MNENFFKLVKSIESAIETHEKSFTEIKELFYSLKQTIESSNNEKKVNYDATKSITKGKRKRAEAAVKMFVQKIPPFFVKKLRLNQPSKKSINLEKSQRKLKSIEKTKIFIDKLKSLSTGSKYKSPDKSENFNNSFEEKNIQESVAGSPKIEQFNSPISAYINERFKSPITSKSSSNGYDTKKESPFESITKLKACKTYKQKLEGTQLLNSLFNVKENQFKSILKSGGKELFHDWLLEITQNSSSEIMKNQTLLKLLENILKILNKTEWTDDQIRKYRIDKTLKKLYKNISNSENKDNDIIRLIKEMWAKYRMLYREKNIEEEN